MSETEQAARDRYRLGATLGRSDGAVDRAPMWHAAPGAWRIAPAEVKEGYRRAYDAHRPTYGYA